MAVNGVDKVIKKIQAAMNEKEKEASQLAHELSIRALVTFKQRQLFKPPEGNSTQVQDTEKKKNAARKYADQHRGKATSTMGIPWTNRSTQAARAIFADSGITEDGHVFFNLHSPLSYVVYLELANNQKHAVLNPIVRGLAPEFLEGLRKIYGG